MFLLENQVANFLQSWFGDSSVARRVVGVCAGNGSKSTEPNRVDSCLRLQASAHRYVQLIKVSFSLTVLDELHSESIDDAQMLNASAHKVSNVN